MKEVYFNRGELSITTDFNGSKNDPSEPIVQAKEAGFDAIHWCHEWNTDYLYSQDEIKSIRETLRVNDIRLLDTHASEGSENLGAYWLSSDQKIRNSGVALIRNRIEMTHALGGRSIVMHIPALTDLRFNEKSFATSMNELRPMVEGTGVRIAFENLYSEDQYPENTDTLLKAIDEYEPSFVGICIDTGHWNLEKHGYGPDSPMWSMKDRILALHIHDNLGRDPQNPDKVTDSHMLPFTGSVDWKGFSEFIADSSYKTDPLSFEHSLKIHREQGMTVPDFLFEAIARGKYLAGMVNTQIRENVQHTYRQTKIGW
jgi:sugar phosphate isomerase/epimerase